MPRTLRLLFVLLVRSARTRRGLLLENLALRQQLIVLKRRHPQPRLATSDKLFWVMLRRLWPGWKRVLVLVQPETVIRWRRVGFKLYWTGLSRHRTRVGRKCVQQLREAFPYDSAPSYLIFDRATNFNEEVIDTVKSFGIQPRRTSLRSPWQNGVAERWVGNCQRRDLLDHVIVLNERHLKRLMFEHARYYHEDRTHLGLAKETPAGREAAEDANTDSRVVSVSRLGGLHHRYDLAA